MGKPKPQPQMSADFRGWAQKIRAIRGQSSFERVMEMGESVYPAPPGAGQVCGERGRPFSIRRRQHVEKLKKRPFAV
jgi:hypothetical protein